MLLHFVLVLHFAAIVTYVTPQNVIIAVKCNTKAK